MLIRHRFVLTATAATWLSAFATSALATPFTLPGNTGSSNRLSLGVFTSGMQVTISCIGQVGLVGGADWFTASDGSLVSNVLTPPYQYANPDSTNYPTFAGGDGVNHYFGGGANVDVAGNGFGFAGLMSTDTTDFDTIRLGAVVATFSMNPTRQSWFAVENGAPIVVSGEAARLTVAINDFMSTDNTGEYQCEYVVPEPATGTLLLLVVGIAANRRGRTARRP